MMDSGSWFAIWAICLRTSFFVIMPRSLLEKKQNREKGQPCNIGSHLSLIPSTLPTWVHRETTFPSYPCRWVGPTERALANGVWVEVSNAPPKSPAHFLSHLPVPDRGVSKGLRSQKMNQEPSDSKTWALG